MARRRRRRRARGHRRGYHRRRRGLRGDVLTPYTIGGLGQLSSGGLQNALLAVASAVGGSLIFGHTLGKLPTTTAGVGGLAAVTGILGGMFTRRWSPSIGDGIAAALGGGGLLILLGRAAGTFPEENPANAPPPAPVAGLGQYTYGRRRVRSGFPGMATRALRPSDYSTIMT